MISMLLVSHGQLAAGVLSAYKMFCGETDSVQALGLTNEGGIESFRSELDEKLAAMTQDGPVLVFADLPGGTPYNETYVRYLAQPDAMRLVAGLNLPMLIETSVMAQAMDDIDALVQTALTAGAAGVMSAPAADDSADEDEDDLF